uniref:Fic family protein n=1 Tax=Phocaeicola plebeius TaxID=310297 RepID=UPI0040258FC4
MLILKLGKEEIQRNQEIVKEHLSQAVLSLSQACPKLNQYTTDVIAEFIYALREKPQSILRLMEILGETNRTRFRNKILLPLMENGYIEPTIKEVPNSPKQLYRLCKKL